MQVLVGDHDPMITAPVQGDVDGISKGAHYASLSLVMSRSILCTLPSCLGNARRHFFGLRADRLLAAVGRMMSPPLPLDGKGTLA